MKPANPSCPRIPSCLLLTVVLCLVSPAFAEWKEHVLYSFQGTPDGSVPAGGVIFGRDGNLYGATSGGGTAGYGTAFQLAKGANGWNETVLHSFTGRPDGDIADSGLVKDSKSNLYGVAAYGGTGDCVLLGILAGCGIVYELSPPEKMGDPWTETIIHNFKGGNDGYLPSGNLVFDSTGNLYGATIFGGGSGGSTCDGFYQYCGMIFELSPPKHNGPWLEKVLYSFKNGEDGGQPNASLAFDNTGALYGTTYCGGTVACQNDTGGPGVIFRLNPPAKGHRRWKYELLFSFSSDGSNGSLANGGLVFDAGGNIYGTTVSGGAYQNGLAFELSPPAKEGARWTETIFYQFTGGTDGGNPDTGLIFDSSGNLYGTTYADGKIYFGGVIFRLGPPVNGIRNFSVLYNFRWFGHGTDGAKPLDVILNHGDLYGTTQYGGSGTACNDNCGTVFEAKP